MLLKSTLSLGLLAVQASAAFVGGRVPPRQQERPYGQPPMVGGGDAGAAPPSSSAPPPPPPPSSSAPPPAQTEQPITADDSVQELPTFMIGDETMWADLRPMLLNDNVQWGAGTEVSFPDDGEVFVNATLRWSSYSSPSYIAAVSPATEEDVAQAVRIARENNVNFLATGGRHGYTSTYGRLRNGLAIDLRQISTVEVDAEAATMTIGGGTRARAMLSAVSEAGFELPIGGCSCPGMVGVTIAGGITNWVGTRGMILDSLLHVRMVTATGEIVTASETENADLFWGLRGAAQNFGIIVSATYQLYPTDPDMLMIETSWTSDMVEDYYHALEEVLAQRDPRLSANSIVNFDPSINQTILFGHYTYFGDHAAGLALLDPILRLNPPLNNQYSVAWTDYHSMTLFNMDEANCVPGAVHNPYGVLTRTFDFDTLMRTFHRFDALYQEHPGSRTSSVVFHSYTPSAALAIPDESTAFAWRDAANYMYVLLTWDPANPEAGFAGVRAASEVRNDFVQTSGYGFHAAYMNFAQGDETIEQVYSERKLPRLSQLKATWDPDNVFRYHFPIPTSYP
jgi:FAD/FMN-containing dehydrogenase